MIKCISQVNILTISSQFLPKRWPVWVGSLKPISISLGKRYMLITSVQNVSYWIINEPAFTLRHLYKIGFYVSSMLSMINIYTPTWGVHNFLYLFVCNFYKHWEFTQGMKMGQVHIVPGPKPKLRGYIPGYNPGQSPRTQTLVSTEDQNLNSNKSVI